MIDIIKIFWKWLELNESRISTIASIITVISVVFMFLELRATAKTIRRDGEIKVNDIYAEISRLSKKVYNEFPPEIVVENNQFSKYPPSPRRGSKKFVGSSLSDRQIKARGNLSKAQKERARKIIGKLNNLGSLAEKKHIRYSELLGKYHASIIRLTSILEAVRKEIEDEGGVSYGHRLLRMRRKAILYHRLIPKHKGKEIFIQINGEKKSILSNEEAKFENIFATIKGYIIFYFCE